ncbi:hypothetical protein CGL51_07540 [Pyrobaculum aerophilum]|uniref:Uncharacterized protein n=1 Tax=Pyrobaculum aerophilum TaxID=13773 RepID=A0A371QY26_9CREN|nr:hypothetical protein CGL51_07540 [Pyrobaculum aerophilum]RFA97643.1 hypothetical protein CGL52_08550 [Pyrobaculum aerophilum]
MATVEKIKRLERMAKYAPAAATLALIGISQFANAMSISPNEICFDGWCIRICGRIGPFKICL